MPIHYLYPASNRTNVGFNGCDSNVNDTILWNKINNGILSYNDNDFITNSGFLVSGVYTDICTVNLDDFVYYPSGSTAFYIRCMQSGGLNNQILLSLGVYNKNNNILNYLSNSVNHNSYSMSVNFYSAGGFGNTLVFTNLDEFENPYVRIGLLPYANFPPSSVFISEIEFEYYGTVLAPRDEYLESYLFTNGGTYADSGLSLVANGAYIDDSGISLHSHGDSGVAKVSTLYIKGGLYEDSGLTLFMDTFGTDNSGLTLITNGSTSVDSGCDLYTSGIQQPYKAMTLYTANIVEESSGVDLYTQGAHYIDSGLNLHIQRCTKDARLQPLYDNDSSYPYESGYGGPMSSNSYLYNGIDGQHKWGFYALMEQMGFSSKYHFNVDSFDGDIINTLNTSFPANPILNADFQSPSYIFIGDDTLTNVGVLVYQNSGRLGLSCPNYNNGALLNTSVNAGYNYTYDLNSSQTGSGLAFPPYEAKTISMSFKLIGSGAGGSSIVHLFGARNTYSFNDDAAIGLYSFISPTSKSISMYAGVDNYFIATGLSDSWNHLVLHCMKTTANNMVVDAYLNDPDTPVASLSFTNYDNLTYPYGEGRRFSFGAAPNAAGNFDGNSGADAKVLFDRFTFSDGVLSPAAVMSYMSTGTTVVQGYFENIGCSGWSDSIKSLCHSSHADAYGGDSDYLYSEPPKRGDDGWGSPSENWVYYYDGYNTDRTVYQTHNIIDFQSRGLDLLYGPYDTYLRFRANVDSPFKVKNISVVDENGAVLASKYEDTLLDGYGTCGPYEILLDTVHFGSGQFNPTKTKIYADFYVDEESLGLISPTGLVHSTQIDNNFRIQYRNHRTYSYWNVFWQFYEFESGAGIIGGHIYSQSNNGFPENARYHNTFGYEFSGISDITSDKYLGVRLTNFDVWSYSGYEVRLNYKVYGDFQSGNSYIHNGSITMSTHPNPNLSSGDITYWGTLPDNLDYESGFQIGFIAEKNFDGDDWEEVDYVIGEPFVYIDTTGQGVASLGQITLTQADVVFEIPCIPTGIDDNITLYTAGHVMSDSGITLYTSGGIHESIPLYTSGMYFARSGLEMYIRGAAHGDMPLYIKGFGGTETKTSTLYIGAQDSGVDYGSISNTLTLFTKSIPLASGDGDGLNLYIAGPESGIVRDFGIEMFTEGYGGTSYAGVDLFSSARDSGVHYGYGANLADLYIQSVPNSSGDMTLYITAPESGFIRDFGIEMYTSGWGGTEYAGTDLVLTARDSGVHYGYGVNSLELYIHSIPNYSGDMTLYITAPESGFLSDSMSLTVNNTDDWVVKYSGFNMYLRALESNNSGVNMFIKTQESYDYSGDLSLHIFGTGVFSSNSNSDLYVGGKSQPDGNINLFLAVATPDSGGTNLYIKGWGGTAIKEMTLYTEGYGGTVSGVTELFILGPNPDKMSGDMSFFIEGGGTDDRGQSVDLHTVGSTDGGYLNSVPMYTIGGFDIGEMPLYLENQQQYSSLAASTDLYVNGFDGTSIEGVFGSSASMYTFGSGSSNQVNLVIVNSGMSSLAQQMPITMVGRDIIYDSTTNGFELSIHNYFDLLTSGIELFMYSQQNYNSSGDMNLYMSRSVESAAMRAEMYVSGPLGENNAFNMYINGGTDSYDSVTLCLPSSVGFEMKKLNTYVHGY